MTVSRERFEQGMTYEAYKQQMTRNLDRLEQNERDLVLQPDDVRFFKELPQRLHVLVITEDWCGDAIANVPVLGRLAAASGKLNLRVFLRDQNPELMDQYLNNGHRSIPVFVFFDEDFREIGRWIERPASISRLLEQRLDQVFASDPVFAGVSRDTSPALMPEEARVRLMETYAAFRAETRELADREVVREIRELLAGHFGSGKQG